MLARILMFLVSIPSVNQFIPKRLALAWIWPRYRGLFIVGKLQNGRLYLVFRILGQNKFLSPNTPEDWVSKKYAIKFCQIPWTRNDDRVYQNLYYQNFIVVMIKYKKPEQNLGFFLVLPLEIKPKVLNILIFEKSKVFVKNTLSPREFMEC